MTEAYLIRIDEIRVGKDAGAHYLLTGAKSIAWNENDPWVLLEVPKGIVIYQQLKPRKFEVKLICMDSNSMYTAFYDTDVDVAGHHAINPTTGERTKIGYFVVIAKDHLNTSHTYIFTDMRVKTIELSNLQEAVENNWVVTFYCSKVQEVV
jgi:hypothetical protein